jgi:peptide/nickel transport system substrate-binding protein
MGEAKRLVRASGTFGMKVTFWSWGDLGAYGPYAVKLLRSLGYHVKMNVLYGLTHFFGTVGNSRTGAQIGTWEWISDYPTASGFFVPVFTCQAFLRGNPGNTNDSEFCDRKHIDPLVRRAETEESTNPDKARVLWEHIDELTTNEAPLVPLVNLKVVDVLSKRVGNYQYTAPLGMLIDQLWVR